MFVAAMTPFEHYADVVAVSQLLAKQTPGLHPHQGLPSQGVHAAEMRRA
jgi:hypothetical protein